MTGPVVLPPCEVATWADAPVEARTAAAWQQYHPTWLYRGILDGRIEDVGSDGRTPYPVEVRALGRIPLPDGAVVACDPYLAEIDQPPLTDRVRAGDHEVHIATSLTRTGGVRVLAAVLVAEVAPIVRWSFGLPYAADVDDLGIGTIRGYGVDAGTGCFLSPAALPAWTEVAEADEGMLEDPVSTALERADHTGAIAAPREGALPIAVFTAGWGDGVYATYLGRAADDRVVVVMTDFDVFTEQWEFDVPSAGPPAGEPLPRTGWWARLRGR